MSQDAPKAPSAGIVDIALDNGDVRPLVAALRAGKPMPQWLMNRLADMLDPDVAQHQKLELVTHGRAPDPYALVKECEIGLELHNAIVNHGNQKRALHEIEQRFSVKRAKALQCLATYRLSTEGHDEN